MIPKWLIYCKPCMQRPDFPPRRGRRDSGNELRCPTPLQNRSRFSFVISVYVKEILDLFVIPLVVALDALVKYRHRFVCRSDLDLHKVGFVVVTGRTNCHSPIHIFPCCSAPENIIYHLSSGKGLLGHHWLDRARIRARSTEKIPWGFWCRWLLRVAYLKQRSIKRTKPHLFL